MGRETQERGGARGSKLRAESLTGARKATDSRLPAGDQEMVPERVPGEATDCSHHWQAAQEALGSRTSGVQACTLVVEDWTIPSR